MRILLSILVFLIITTCKSQDFRYEADIAEADSNGYYKIVLSPVIWSSLNRNMADLRIYDPEGKEVPYLLEEESDSLSHNFEEIPEVNFKQKNNASTKKTTLEINLKETYRLDKIEFDLESPVQYRRWGEIVGLEMGERKRRWRKRRKQEVHIPIELSSEDPLSYDLSGLKTDHLFVYINNEDNPPLKFKRVRILQLRHYLVAHLDKDKHYSVKFGNNDMSMPNYDLTYFKSKIPVSLPSLKISDAHPVATNIEPILPFYKTKAFLWTIIIGVMLFLAFISIRMVKDLSKDK